MWFLLYASIAMAEPHFSESSKHDVRWRLVAKDGITLDPWWCSPYSLLYAPAISGSSIAFRASMNGLSGDYDVNVIRYDCDSQRLTSVFRNGTMGASPLSAYMVDRNLRPGDDSPMLDSSTDPPSMVEYAGWTTARGLSRSLSPAQRPVSVGLDFETAPSGIAMKRITEWAAGDGGVVYRATDSRSREPYFLFSTLIYRHGEHAAEWNDEGTRGAALTPAIALSHGTISAIVQHGYPGRNRPALALVEWRPESNERRTLVRVGQSTVRQPDGKTRVITGLATSLGSVANDGVSHYCIARLDSSTWTLLRWDPVQFLTLPLWKPAPPSVLDPAGIASAEIGSVLETTGPLSVGRGPIEIGGAWNGRVLVSVSTVDRFAKQLLLLEPETNRSIVLLDTDSQRTIVPDSAPISSFTFGRQAIDGDRAAVLTTSRDESPVVPTTNWPRPGSIWLAECSFGRATDLNCDGVTDEVDLELFTAALVAAAPNEISGATVNGDLNHDGVVDFLDYQAIVLSLGDSR